MTARSHFGKSDVSSEEEEEEEEAEGGREDSNGVGGGELMAGGSQDKKLKGKVLPDNEAWQHSSLAFFFFGLSS